MTAHAPRNACPPAERAGEQAPVARPVGVADDAQQPAQPAEQRRDGEVDCWGLAPPSSIEGYIDRWSIFFAADSTWRRIFCVQMKVERVSDVDPLAHQVFCRRLAAAMTPMCVESSGAQDVQSWGPAPPSTREDYGIEWVRWCLDTLERARRQNSASPQPVERVLVVPPPPLAPSLPAPPPPTDAEQARPSTPVAPSLPAPPPPTDAEQAGPSSPVARLPAAVTETASPLAASPSTLPEGEASMSATPALATDAPAGPVAAPASSPPAPPKPRGASRRDTSRSRATSSSPPVPAGQRLAGVAERPARARGLLTTDEATAYCGFETTGALRKARLEGRVVAAGRRGGTGTWMWDPGDLDRFLRGEAPQERVAAAEADRSGVPERGRTRDEHDRVLHGDMARRARPQRGDGGAGGGARSSSGSASLNAMATRVVDLLVNRLVPTTSAAEDATPRYATAKNNPLGSPRAFLNAHRDGKFPTYKRGKEISADWSVVEAWMRSRKAQPAERATMADELDAACAAPKRRTHRRSE